MERILTAGQIRSELSRSHATWQVHTAFQDSDSLDVAKHHGLGADVAGKPTANQVPRIDITPILKTVPANPFILQRRIELEHIDAATVAPGQLPPKLVAPTVGGARQSAVDWRNRFGFPWLTTMKDQNGCESCWSFGATGVVESMTRIEHAVWSLRSEGDVHDGMGAKCGNGGWPSNALDYMVNHGIADPDCWPYHTDDAPYKPSADRNGRTVRLADYVTLGNMEDQKRWVDAVGPITACFEVFHDFDYYGTGVYRHVTGYDRGAHCVYIVGYDDNMGAWLIRNSWGNWGGMGGYCWFGYGECNIDTWPKYAVHNTNPDPWTKRRLHSGNMIESGNGATHRNFEMLATAPGNTIRHFWREGSTFAWHAASTFGNDAAVCPTLTGTTYNRNFESVHLTTTRRLHHWFYDQSAGHWADGGVFGPADAAGVPGFLQGDYGKPGNFEVVVRTADGRLNHFWRINGPPWTWNDGGRFAANVAFSGATLVQRRDRGLDVVCVLNNRTMQRWWRDDAHGFAWKPGEIFGTEITSPACMIEGQFGAGNEMLQGNYELCVAAGGVVQHWWRNNSVANGAWSMSARFGHDVAAVTALVEGSYGFNLEVIVLKTDGALQHYYRDGAGWHEGPVIGSTMAAPPPAAVAALAGVG